MFQSRDVEENGRLQLVFARHFGLSRFARAGEEAFMLYAVVNHTDSFAWNVEEFPNIARGVFADGDDSVLPLSQSAGNDTPVEGSGPIILFCDTKWREVVNRGHEWAGPGPE